LRSNPVAPTNAQLADSHHILQAMGISPTLRFNDAPYAWQRLALVARALVASKPLIILDEPDQGLDSASRQVLWQIIDNYAQKNLVVSSHHQDNISMQLDWHLDLNDPSA
jgi:ABC-type molybdenum transport system ATPase subunit/photorepair protein PhrA